MFLSYQPGLVQCFYLIVLLNVNISILLVRDSPMFLSYYPGIAQGFHLVRQGSSMFLSC